MSFDIAFWTALDKLVETSEVVIDRPKGSIHPRFPQIVYPLDYGYLAATSAGDGKEIDVWIGSLDDKRVVGAAVTVDLQKRDSEIKLLLGLTDDEIAIVEAFHNGGEQSAVVLRRGRGQGVEQ